MSRKHGEDEEHEEGKQEESPERPKKKKAIEPVGVAAAAEKPKKKKKDQATIEGEDGHAEGAAKSGRAKSKLKGIGAEEEDVAAPAKKRADVSPKPSGPQALKAGDKAEIGSSANQAPTNV
jgi:hypothetical protein